MSNPLDDAQKNKLRLIVDGGSFAMFFRFRGEVYGAGEADRVTFATMMNPRDEDWVQDGNFTATNLNKLTQGAGEKGIFGKADLTKIEVLRKDEAYKALEEIFEKGR